jgi:hypothetical protein
MHHATFQSAAYTLHAAWHAMAWSAMAVRRARTRTRVLSHNLCACAFGRVQCAGASANAAGPSADADGNTKTDGRRQVARNGRATREARVGTPQGTTAPERTDRAARARAPRRTPRARPSRRLCGCAWRPAGGPAPPARCTSACTSPAATSANECADACAQMARPAAGRVTKAGEARQRCLAWR